MRHEIMHSIEMAPNRRTHKVFLRIPIAKGWIDNVKFYIWKENELQEFGLEYDFEVSDETYAYFKTEADLASCQFNYYFFCYEVDNVIRYDRHVNGPYQWSSEDEEILEFYQETMEYSKNGIVFKSAHRILEISWEHLIVERYCGQSKVIIIANRSENKLRICIPRKYSYSQVVFCTEGSNSEILLPYGAIVLKK